MSSGTNTPPAALSIAGSDSGGGAGLQADIKALSRLGVHPCTVVTAVTAQNTRGVQGISPLDSDFVETQLNSVLDDVSIRATKTGMLFNSSIIGLVAARAGELGQLVVDPVMVAESGDSLLKPAAEAKMVVDLLPAADLITPNWPETKKIAKHLGLSLDADITHLGQNLSRELSGVAVLIKGGHRRTETATDLLFETADKSPLEVSAPRLDTSNNHGTGCAYSSFITGYLARGKSLSRAVEAAKEELTQVLKNGYEYGDGAGTMNLLSPSGSSS